MSKIEDSARVTLLALFEKELQAAMPTLREISLICKPVRVFHNAWSPRLAGPLAPHDEISWFPIPGLRSRARDYGVAVNGRLIVWRDRPTGGGYYFYSSADEQLSNEELHKANTTLQQINRP